MSRVWMARVLAAAVVVTSGAGLSVDSAGATEEPRLDDELIVLTNVDRTSNGLPALSVDLRLVDLAVERSEDMAARDYFSHAIPPDGRTVFDLMAEQGISFKAAGENLAFNNAPGSHSVRYAQEMLMESPGHRTLILSPDFDHLGVGVGVGSEDRLFYTVLFLGLGSPVETTRAAPTAEALPLAREDEVVIDAAGGEEQAVPSESVLVAHVVAEPAGPRSLRPSTPRRLGLIEELVNRTLRQHLGL